jgi:hypothetical protein
LIEQHRAVPGVDEHPCGPGPGPDVDLHFHAQIKAELAGPGRPLSAVVGQGWIGGKTTVLLIPHRPGRGGRRQAEAGEDQTRHA